MADPSEKYRDKVDLIHKQAVEAIGMAYFMLDINRAHFEVFMEAKRRMESIGHITDPTLYRDMLYSKSFERQTKLIEAALAFLRCLDPIVAEVESGDAQTQ